MRHSRAFLFLAFYLLFGTVAGLTANGQQPVPSGAASQVSDWALAGMVWSDACLTQKVLTKAIDESTNENQKKRFQQLLDETNAIVSSLEQFGWKKVSGPALAAKPPVPAQRRPDGPLGIKRIDTETPAGLDDPGLDDERVMDDSRLNINRYRVDDFVDETIREQNNVADALEDGVEEAIAARGLPLAGQPFGRGRISYRESQTRSGTMPYSIESIYDYDDYDPDVDYRAENPDAIDDLYDVNPTINPLGVSADRFGDNDDDVNPLNPAIAIEGEDELLADIIRNDNLTNDGDDVSVVQGSTPRPSRQVQARPYRMDRYTADRSRFQNDADWIQLQLDANQMMWQRLSGAFSGEADGDRLKAVQFARLKLLNTGAIAFQSSGDERLKEILEPMVSRVE